jgi:hypothetical protein
MMEWAKKDTPPKIQTSNSLVDGLWTKLVYRDKSPKTLTLYKHLHVIHGIKQSQAL